MLITIDFVMGLAIGLLIGFGFAFIVWAYKDYFKI